MNGPSDLLTLSETLAMLKVSRATVFRRLADGLPSVGVGRLRRFDKAQVLAWWSGGLETGRDGQVAPPSTGDEGAELLGPGTYCCGCGWHVALLAARRADAVRCARCGTWDDLVRAGDVPAAR